MTELNYNTQYPAISDLRNRAQEKIPRFAFEYMDGGCNEDVNIVKNTTDIRDIELKPFYLTDDIVPSLKTSLFGQEYDAPFGVSPIGLQGLIWPNSPEILATAAHQHNIPFVLSTVSTASIERIGEITQGNFWFQLYHPAKDELRDDLLDRAATSGCEVLVILCDVPSFGFRPRDIRNGLAMPPNMSLRNILQICGRPHWAINTLIKGQPEFANMKKYMPKGLDLKQLGAYMNQTFSGKVNEDKLAAIRDRWKGKLVLKGVASVQDAEKAHKLGLDGIIVSNHGGRQLDAGESSIHSMHPIIKEYKDKMTIMIDSGLRSGPDIARTMAAGADFTFLGRSFMYSVAALGNQGGHHMMSLLKVQLNQIMEQLCCEKTSQFPQHLI